LSNHELIDIKDIFLGLSRRSKKELTQLWYETVIEFISRKYKGSMIIPAHIREAEDKILQDDRFCQEYVSALMKVVDTELVQLTEHQKLVLIIGATADERDEAIKLVQS
jgi:hypothetical protein